jgi:hypothetical protein
MKKLILACIFFFGLLPVWQDGSLSLLQGSSASAQNTQATLLAYLQMVHPGLTVQNATGSNCACQVTVYWGDGTFTTYTPQQYAQENPAYNAYSQNVNNAANNGQNNTGTGPSDDGNNQQSVEFNIWFSLWAASIDLQAQQAINQAEYQAWYNDIVFAQETSGSNGSNVSCYGGTGETWDFSFTQAYAAPAELGSPDDTPGGGSTVPNCPAKYLVGTKIVSFATSGPYAPDTLLFNNNGSEVLGVKIKGATYGAAIQYSVPTKYDVTTAAKIMEGALNCDNGYSSTWADTLRRTLFSRPRHVPHFVNFSGFVGPHPFGSTAISGQLGINGPTITAWEGIPDNMPNVSFTLDSLQAVPATAGATVRLARMDSNGHFMGYYCITLMAEDTKRGLGQDRNTKYLPPALRLQYPVNVPTWAQELLDLIPALYLGECAIEHANKGLDKLHQTSSYQALPTDNEKRKAEYKSLAYDLVFGYLYCRTNEDVAKDEGCAAQAAMGMLHEMIAMVDVAQMKEGIVQLASGLGNMLLDNVQNILDAVENASKQEKTQDSLHHGGFNIERFVKSFGDSTISGLDSAWNKLSGMAQHFKEMYFTKCHISPVEGQTGTYNLCCYRRGQLTMMAAPIILTAGDYAVMKLTNLAAKYGSRGAQAMQMLADAERVGAHVLEDATGKLIIKESDEIGADVIATQKKVGDDIEITGEQDLAAVIDEGDLAVEIKPAPPIYGNVITETPGNKANRWNKKLNKELEPNKRYKVGNHTYHTDDLGRVKEVTCNNLQRQARDRNQYQQSVKCKKVKNGQADDQGGHLIGSQFDGAGEQINLVPMKKSINQPPGTYAEMEQQWANAINNGGTVTNVKIEIIYGAGNRPIGFDVTADVNGIPRQWLHNNQ